MISIALEAIFLIFLTFQILILKIFFIYLRYIFNLIFFINTRDALSCEAMGRLVFYKVPMCNGKVKSVDYPLMDEPIGNNLLKSNDRMKQKDESAMTVNSNFISNQYISFLVNRLLSLDLVSSTCYLHHIHMSNHIHNRRDNSLDNLNRIHVTI